MWWTDPYTAWAAKKKADKGQKRKAGEAALDADTEARLAALRDGPGASAGASAGGGSSSGAGGGIGIDPDIEARLKALRGEGGSAAPAEKETSYTTKGYDSD